MISVVEFASFEGGEEESVDHVAKKVGFLRLEALVRRDVGKHLLLQDLVGVTETTVFGEVRGGSSSSDEVEGDLRKEEEDQLAIGSSRSGNEHGLTSRSWIMKASSIQGLSMSSIAVSFLS